MATIVFTLLAITEFLYFIEHGGSLALILLIAFATNAYLASKIEE